MASEFFIRKSKMLKDRKSPKTTIHTYLSIYCVLYYIFSPALSFFNIFCTIFACVALSLSENTVILL